MPTGTQPTVSLKSLESKPILQPNLVWATGTVSQILVQPGEQFYIFALRTSTSTILLRIANPHTGAPLPGVTSDNPIFDLMKEVYLRKLNVEVGYRDFGPDPQSGINKLCIDRVSLTQ
ncbi:MAG TPA: hypothetical protein VGZ29_00555 [Terriglobia bacterium]|nr:hypothetical protein [Terriglobia bacterium]